ncbi:MAG: hypothetical protein MJ097_02050 [Dorea sp.]|nr:hypothetical protein [Dorea sp.]
MKKRIAFAIMLLFLSLVVGVHPLETKAVKHDSRFNGFQKEKGIDVSEWQGEIDWKKVAKDGIQFAIIRVAHRDPESGELFKDKRAADNLKAAKKAGIEVGAYIYSQAISTEEAKDEVLFADKVIRKSGVELDLPLVMDFEYMSGIYGDTGRLYNAGLSMKAATNVCTSFFEVADEKGYVPMLYANSWMLGSAIDAEKLSKTGKIWIAEYEESVSYKGTYDYWQYSAWGSVDGISGNVDLDYRYYEKKYFITHIFALDPPKQITGEAELDSITISWEENPEASGYYIEKYDPASTKYYRVKELEDGSKTSWTDTHVNADAAYTYRIQTYKTKKNLKSISGYSEDYTIKTKEAVDGIVLTNDVYVRREGKMSADILSLFDRKTEVRIIGGYGDWYRINQEEFGINGYIYKDFVAPEPELTEAGEISVKTRNFHSIDITWEKINQAEGYLLQKYNEDTEEFEDLISFADPDILSFTDESLEAKEKATYRVAGLTSVKEYLVPGDFSDAKKGKAASPKVGTIKKDTKALKNPEQSAKAIKKLYKGEKVEVAAIYGDYYKIVVKSGKKARYGYILSKRVTFRQ